MKILMALPLLVMSLFSSFAVAQTQVGPSSGSPAKVFYGQGNPTGPCNSSVNKNLIYIDTTGNNIWTCTDNGYAQLASTSSPSTNISVLSVNGVQNGTLATGTDLGAKITTAFGVLIALGNYGTVTLDPTVDYSYSTPITIPRGDTLDCQGAVLSFTPTSGAAVVYGDTTTNYVRGGLRNCTISGGSPSNSAIGFYSGADPSAVITPANTFGNFFSIQNSSITGFGTGITHGSNSWAGLIDNSLIYNNTNGFYSAPTNAVNDGEGTTISHSKVFNNLACGFNLNNASDVYWVSNSNLDYNANGAVCGTQASITLRDDWMEQYIGPLVNVTGTSGSDNVKIDGGNAVLTATPYTVTNVAVNGSNLLTVTTSTSITGFVPGYNVAFSGLTGATFLNGQSVQIISSSGNTFTANFSHATYNATDSGTVTPVSADLFHVEGAYQSYLTVERVSYNPKGGSTLTNGIGVGYTGASPRTHVCTMDASQGSTVFLVNGSIISGCAFASPIQVQVGSSQMLVAPSNLYNTAIQGWAINWNDGLSGLSGEMDFINTHGGGSGGFVFCDGAFNYTPGTCQFTIDTSGNTLAQGNSTADQFMYTTVAAGPNAQESNDFFMNTGTGSGAIGSPTSNAYGVSTTVQDINHPGNIVLTSGTVSGAGEYATGEPSGAQAWQSLNTTPGWKFDTIVYVPVLPGTTAASYEIGLYHNPNLLQNSGGGQGFYLSSANGNPNHWYCSYGANVNTDSGVTATVAWTHLSMVQNGTNLLWYVNGTQVCSTAIANVTSLTSYINWKAVAGSTTSVNLYVDWYVMQRQLTR